MPAPSYVGSPETENGFGTSAVMTIPAGATTGQRLVAYMDVRTNAISATPTGWTPLESGGQSQAGARSYAYTAVVTSGGVTDPSDTVTFSFGGNNTAWTGSIHVIAASEVLDSTIVNSITGSQSTMDADVLDADVDALFLFAYVGITNAQVTGGQTVAATWTADAATTERCDVGLDVGSGRHPSHMVATEARTAGTSVIRTATPSVPIQGQAITIALGTPLDRPLCALTANATTVSVGSTVVFTIAPSGGSGAPYTQLLTHVSGPATPTIVDPTTTTPEVTFTVVGTYVLRGVATDDTAVDSLPDDITITVVGAQDTARPVADITTTGWTKNPSGAATFAAVLADPFPGSTDPSTSDDTTYIELADASSANPIKVQSAPVAVPVASENYRLWLYASFVGTGTGKFTPTLMEGVTVIKAWPEQEWTFDEEVNYIELILTPAEYAAVSNWADLDVLITPGNQV